LHVVQSFVLARPAALVLIAALASSLRAQTLDNPTPPPLPSTIKNSGPSVTASYLAGRLPTAPDSVAAYGPDLFGDKASLYNGSLEFEQTDTALPGNSALPVALTRRFSPGRNPQVRGQLGDWDLALPHIGGSFSQPGWVTQGGGPNRCSGYSAPPAYSDNGVGFDSSVYWQGTTLNVPGQGAQELLLRSPSYQGKPLDGGTYPIVTRSNWQIDCLPGIQNGGGEGFVAVSPEGVRYRFDWMATRYLPGVRKGNAAAGRTEHFLFATQVTDRFGNWVRYIFDPNNPTRLLSITSSDARTITLQYADGKLASASDGTRSFGYAYNQQGDLSAVQQPDGSRWTYNLGPMLHVNHEELGEGADCNLPGVYPQTPLVGTMTHPSGAIGTFKTQFMPHGKTFVQQACWYVQGTSGPTIGAVWRRLARSQTLTEKTITGPGMAPMTWLYSYLSESS
jgi:YD repeat-containing protein